MVENKLEKLRKNLDALEERINNLIGDKRTDDGFEKVRKHKRTIKEIQEYYDKKVR